LQPIGKGQCARCVSKEKVLAGAKVRKAAGSLNEKTPVISRSLFINQKTNSHENAVTPTKYKLNANIPTWEYFNTVILRLTEVGLQDFASRGMF
jgi:hypothetical protein